MQQYSFWRRQEKSKPLFPDIEWNRPERRDQAGRLAVIGGNKLGFAAAADGYRIAQEAGVGAVRVLLPDALKKSVPSSMTDVLFAPTNPSGGLASEAIRELKTLDGWADAVLFIGDAGKNSQTAAVYEEIVASSNKPIVLTRDAIDLMQNNFSVILDKPNLVFIASFAQLQKLFRSVYYPKIITFSMQLAQLVDTLHKFTITYPVTLTVFHAEHLIIAQGGEVITQAWDEPMVIWRGLTAARAASYLVWSPEAPLAAVAASIAAQL